MPLLGELLDLVEQKKTLYSPIAQKWLNWDESKQKYRLRHYLMEGEWDNRITLFTIPLKRLSSMLIQTRTWRKLSLIAKRG